LAELKELLERIPCRPSVDHLIFLGDLMDRGPESTGAIRFVRELSLDRPAVTAGDGLRLRALFLQWLP
jgi:Calcineurin-like phosphoesterase